MAEEIARGEEITPESYLLFKGYADASEEPILQPGELVKVVSYSAKDGIIVMAAADSERADTLFEEECLRPSQEEIDAKLAELGIASEPVVEASTEEAEPEATDAGSDEPAQTEEAAAEAAPADAPAGEEEAASKPAKKPAAKKPAAKRQTKKQRAKDAVAKNAEKDAKAGKAESRAADLASRAGASGSVETVLQTTDALQAAESLAEQIEQSEFTLGGVLAHIYSEGLHKSLGYNGKRAFANYVDERLGIQYRKAMYLIEIYSAFTKLGIPESRLAEIGWSKAKELVKIEDPDTVMDLLEYAKTHTRTELVQHIKESVIDATDGATRERVRAVKFTFNLTGDAAAMTETALKSAENLAGVSDANSAFEFIVTEWTTMTSGIEVPLEDAIRALEARYNVTVAATPNEAGETVTETEQVEATAVAG